MESNLEKLPAELSGGMKKRAGLARALALDPEILMFDEPTAGLDPVTSAEIDELILGLKNKRNITSIIVTHDIHSAQQISDRVVMLDEGRIVEEGTFRDFEKSSNPIVTRFLRGAV
jgi:phospholipid/cholesterol/gamma-HCH transport system ATP-binding protein